MSENKSNLKLINDDSIGELFDMMADAYTDRETGEGAVVLGIFSKESEGLGFHAAHGDLTAIAALVTSIIRHTAEESGMPPLMMCELIARAILESEGEDEYKS